METIILILDRLYGQLISPAVALFAHGLEFVLLGPMGLLHFPAALQVAVLGGLTGLLSLWLRHRLRIREREQRFLQEFGELKKIQQPIAALDDWKARDVLYRTSDQLLDEEFNTYLAQRFAWHVMTYLLPIFCVLAWIDALPGSGFARAMSLPVPAVFLGAYVVVLIGGALYRRRRGRSAMLRPGFQQQ